MGLWSIARSYHQENWEKTEVVFGSFFMAVPALQGEGLHIPHLKTSLTKASSMGGAGLLIKQLDANFEDSMAMFYPIL